MLDLRVLMESADTLVNKDSKVLLESRVIVVTQDLRDYLDPRVLLVAISTVIWKTRSTHDMWVNSKSGTDCQEKDVKSVTLVYLESLVQEENREMMAKEEWTGYQEQMEFQDSKECQENLERREIQARKGRKEMPDNAAYQE